MKTIPTVEGKFYCVATSTSCEVTTEAGTLLGTAEAGQPLWFQAQKGDTTTLSDDNAECSASRFNSAPQQQLAVIGVLGGNDDRLPAGYTRVAYLESTGTEYIDTGYYVKRGDVIRFTVQYKKYINAGNGFEPYVIGNYSFAFQYVLYCVNHSNDYEQGGWCVVKDLSARYIHPEGVKNYDKIAVEWSENGLKENGRSVLLTAFSKISPDVEMSMSLFKRHARDGSFAAVGAAAKIFSFSVENTEKETVRYVPVLTAEGPAFYDVVNRQTLYNLGTGAFIAGIEKQSQLDAILRKLPDRTGQDVGTLTVRLSDDLQTEANRAALDAMVAKNWEITEAA